MCSHNNSQFLVVSSRTYMAGTNNPVMLNVTQLGQYNSCSCNSTYNYNNCCSHSTYRDDPAYQIALAGTATKGVLCGIADVIRAVNEGKSAKTSNTNVDKNTNVNKNTNTNTNTNVNSNTNVPNTSIEEIQNAAESDFSKKWKNIGDKYKDTDKKCEDYKKTEDTVLKAELKSQLTTIQGNVSQDIKALKEDLKKDGLSEEDKAIGKKALETLTNIQSKIDETLKADGTKQPEKTKETSETEEVENKKQDTTDLDKLRADAKKAQAAYRKNYDAYMAKIRKGEYDPTEEKAVLNEQKSVIEKYNKWADAVVKYGDKAPEDHITDCKASLDYICKEGHNVSTGIKDAQGNTIVEGVTDLVNTSRSLLSKIK